MTRDEVIKALEICTGANQKCEECPLLKETWCNDVLDKAALALLKAEPKRGRWVEEEDVFGDTTYVCSVCGEPWTLIEGTPAENSMYYCPNCGAKIDGVVCEEDVYDEG